jgi:hypothetical protein
MHNARRCRRCAIVGESLETQIVRHIGSISTSIETATRANEFVHIARNLMLANGRGVEAARHAHSHNSQQILRSNVVGIRKGAVDAGSTTVPGWAEQLAAYELLAAAYITSLRPYSAFEQMFPFMIQLPPHTKATFVTLGATGSTPGEAQPIPISKLTVDDARLQERISAAIVVADAEVLRFSVGASNLFEQQLRYATARAVDDEMLSIIVNNTSAISNGHTPGGTAAADIENALKLMSLGQNSKVFCIAPPDWVKGASLERGSGGSPLFPNLRIDGGDINGVTVIPSDSLTDDVVLLDATRCIAASGTLLLDASEQGALQLDDNPTSPGPLVSLWQANLRALRVRRIWSFEILEPSSAAIITSATA